MSTEVKETEDSHIQLVSFRLGSVMYAIDVARIQEIKKLSEIDNIPQIPSYCVGMITLKGENITVVDLRKKLYLEPIEWNESTRIIIYEVDGSVTGLIVDGIEEVLMVPITFIESLQGITSTISSCYVLGIVRFNERFLLLFDIDRIANEVAKDMDISINSYIKTDTERDLQTIETPEYETV